MYIPAWSASKSYHDYKLVKANRDVIIESSLFHQKSMPSNRTNTNQTKCFIFLHTRVKKEEKSSPSPNSEMLGRCTKVSFSVCYQRWTAAIEPQSPWKRAAPSVWWANNGTFWASTKQAGQGAAKQSWNLQELIKHMNSLTGHKEKKKKIQAWQWKARLHFTAPAHQHLDTEPPPHTACILTRVI